ncbi:TrbG/VirB9 family P-type conjugative transfer protein [Brevundimonas sp.]|uniref:TrbG/VirB9 family P-type conjugative transfer protein n=1 Tax=Brevundimonas sp. TaxID=1871086 RepID=UPI0028AECE4C|nr:TrbG/VirB9 family P-type conjugative transfer protein [Brevundimonas sp.]
MDPRGRAPRWTPTAVFNDGTRTFITFSPDLQVDEAPALFVIAPDGEAEMVNYRQQGGLFLVDRVFDRAELRLGDRRPQIVRLHRLGSADRIGRTDRVAGGRS